MHIPRNHRNHRKLQVFCLSKLDSIVVQLHASGDGVSSSIPTCWHLYPVRCQQSLHQVIGRCWMPLDKEPQSRGLHEQLLCIDMYGIFHTQHPSVGRRRIVNHLQPNILKLGTQLQLTNTENKEIMWCNLSVVYIITLPKQSDCFKNLFIRTIQQI